MCEHKGEKCVYVFYISAHETQALILEVYMSSYLVYAHYHRVTLVTAKSYPHKFEAQKYGHNLHLFCTSKSKIDLLKI